MGTYSRASYLCFSSGRKGILWINSFFSGSLRSTNFMSFLRRRQRSCMSKCSKTSAPPSPDPRRRVIVALKISGCSTPPVMWRNLMREYKSLTELMLSVLALQQTDHVCTYIGVPVRTHRDFAPISHAAKATLVLAFRIVWPSSSTTRRHSISCERRTLLTPFSRSRESFP